MKRISFHVEHEQVHERFLSITCLVEKLFEFTSEVESQFRSLEFLEIVVDNPLPELIDCRGRLRIHMVWNDTILRISPEYLKSLHNPIRYLVRRCYQMVQKLPKLKICIRNDYQISDFSRTTLIRRPNRNVETKTITNKEVVEYLGIDKNAVKEFYNGNSHLLSGLRSIEFGDIPGTFANSEQDEDLMSLKLYWQMVFAKVWAKIWEKGIVLPEADGGYTELTKEELNAMGFRTVSHMGPV